MNVYDELNKIMSDLRDRIAVAKNDAVRHEVLANENTNLARQKRAEAMAYEGTLDRLSKIETPK